MKKHKIGWRIGRRMSGDRLDGRDVTFQRPKPSTLIHQIEMTARTRYCGTREVFNGC
jgi:hypothetical protein